MIRCTFFAPPWPSNHLSFIVTDAVLIYLSAVELSLTVSLLHRSNEGRCCRIRAREWPLCPVFIRRLAVCLSYMHNTYDSSVFAADQQAATCIANAWMLERRVQETCSNDTTGRQLVFFCLLPMPVCQPNLTCYVNDPAVVRDPCTNDMRRAIIDTGTVCI